jgi:hypothetical protein
MAGIKNLIAEYTRAVTQYYSTDPALRARRIESATRVASVALAIALRSNEHHAVWCAVSEEWAQIAYSQSEAVA